MNKEWVLTQDAFDALLNWLDPDRDRAGSRYESIRLRLIKIFTCRGCLEAEDLADETINRVSARIQELTASYMGDPALYFYGVSQKIHLEYLRKCHTKQAEAPADSMVNTSHLTTFSKTDDIEPEYQCLEKCLEHLPGPNRKLVVQYYQQEKQAKIDHRKRLAEQLGIAVNALRIRAHRIRLGLQQCVRDCLEQQPVN
jgi:DNA-directed RNA polymerase specialized sigma24 family protein